MKTNIIFFILLYPFSILYGAIISLRNIFYEIGVLKATSFNVPLINVGNLSLGGTGKTPHIEYLIELLTPYINIATLSRGYKRKTKGFRLVSTRSNALESGDEPLQFKTKFPEVPVAVSESRNIGVPQLIKHHPEIQTILLDDAFQHRSVIPGLNILLTDYSNPFYEDYLLPLGRLREPRDSYERADIIVVTKCPDFISPEEKNEIVNKLNPLHHQKVFFSNYTYKDPYLLFDSNITTKLTDESHIILISAIANVDYLLDYLVENCKVENIVKFEDHHYFTEMELERFYKIYQNIETENTFFLTTEKDAMRLALHREYLIEKNIPVFVLPASVNFLDDDKDNFDSTMKEYLLEFKV